MLHIQNQRFSTYSSSYFSTSGKSEEMIQFSYLRLANTAKPLALKAWALLLIFMVSLLGSLQLQAASNAVDDRVTIRVADQTREVREQAFQRGLDKMFIRIMGDTSVLKTLERPESRRFVQQFRYEPLTTTVFDEQGELLTQRLKIRYNKSLIERYLRQNGLVEDETTSTESAAQIHVEIEAVDSMKKYNHVENYLTQLSAVKSVNPLNMDADKASFEIVLRKSEAAFLTMLDNDRRFLKVKKAIDEKVTVLKVESKLKDLNIAGSKQQNNSAFDKFKNTEKPLAPQAEINAAKTQSTTLTSTVSEPQVSETKVNQAPVYYYRFVQ